MSFFFPPTKWAEQKNKKTLTDHCTNGSNVSAAVSLLSCCALTGGLPPRSPEHMATAIGCECGWLPHRPFSDNFQPVCTQPNLEVIMKVSKIARLQATVIKQRSCTYMHGTKSSNFLSAIPDNNLFFGFVEEFCIKNVLL